MDTLGQTAGIDTQVVQSYGLDSLVSVSALVVDVREFIIRKRNGSRPSCKQVQQFPQVSNFTRLPGILDVELSEKLYGSQAGAVLKRLVDRGYAVETDQGNTALSWRFRNLSSEDFKLGLGDKADAEVYQSLDTLLWAPLPEEDGVETFLRDLRGEHEGLVRTACRISGTEYWFRQGIAFISVRFRGEPSQELISLIDHKLQVIQQEKMQNYFHILGSFNADSNMWMVETDRSRRFFEIVEHLLAYTWRPFDMEKCEVSIDAAGDDVMIASGTLSIDFSESGKSRTRFDQMAKIFPTVEPGSREFSVNDVSLRSAGLTGESSSLGLHLVSRSAGNVDPRQNLLVHRYIKLFIESVGKLIDVIMPVIRREEALHDLRWRSFLDSQRLRALENGENLHRIVNQNIKVLKKFFGISNVHLFSEDREVGHMLDLFSRGDEDEKHYRLIPSPLSPADILKRQLMVFPIREIQGGRILLYFEPLRTGKRPLNPEIPDQYLVGTELWDGVREEAMLLGVQDLRDYIFFMVTECFTTNPKKVFDNLNRRLPVRGNVEPVDALNRLAHRVMDRYSRFFDLFGAFSGSLESGLAYMRGRRDNLTGLYNRQYFTAQLHESFSRPGYSFGLMFIDMDNFKICNDAVSHEFGDKILVSLANRLIEAADEIRGAHPGRFGGDEFCFTVGGVDVGEFEKLSVDIFRSVTERPLMVSFYLDDRAERDAMEVNLISFLHRLMRPDVGSRQASRTEYVEKPNSSPRAHVVDIWKHYRVMNGEPVSGLKVKGETIIDGISDMIEDKIIYNKIFNEIDPEFSRVIRFFVTLQFKDYTTNRIRDYLISDLGRLSLERQMAIKVSAGLAHSSEHRLRSVESLFKAADGRSYLAKHNGRNCLFGVDGEQLA